MRALWLCCAVSLASCSLQTKGRGEPCQRTAQCSLGLACVEGRCTKDLRAVAEENTVPDLSAGAGGSDAEADTMGGGAGGAP